MALVHGDMDSVPVHRIANLLLGSEEHAMNPHPESKWTHSICVKCYAIAEPDRTPTRLIDPEPETCCFCDDPTMDGIYIRSDPVIHDE